MKIYFNYLIRFLIVIVISLETNYIRWRINFLCKHYSPLLLLYTFCEIVVMSFGTMNTYFVGWNCLKALPEPEKSFNELVELPDVEIYLMCCREPLEIISKSINKAIDIIYPAHKLSLTIADDGKSEELENYVHSIKEENLHININYKHRKVIKGHCKAGNINDTLYSSECVNKNSLILILDSDMQCEPQILEILIPYFHNEEKLAFVQSPQAFINIDRGDTLGQSYVYFYKIIMKSWALWGCVPCCGTNVLFSRKALEEIGGFQYGSVTEDFLTSMYLHSKKYTSKYCDKVLAHGLAPFSLEDFYKQRFRWALGGFQLLRYIPKVCGKLNLIQSWIYLSSALFTLFTPLLLFLVLSILLTCYFPQNIYGDKFYSYYFGPFMCVHFLVLLMQFYEIPYLYLVRSFQETVYMLNCNILVFFYAILNLPYSFKITPKNSTNNYIRNLLWCSPYLIYYGFTIHIILKKEISIIHLCWLLLICFQMLPPIWYCLSYIF